MMSEHQVKVAKRRKATNVFYIVADQLLTRTISFFLGH